MWGGGGGVGVERRHPDKYAKSVPSITSTDDVLFNAAGKKLLINEA